MDGLPSYPDIGISSQDPGLPPGGGQRARRPRWQMAVIAVLLVALLAVMLMLPLTGALGPGTHG